MDRSKKIAKAMLKYRPCPDFEELAGKADLSNWGLTRATRILLEKNPNAFLIGGVFDLGINAEDAWERPLLLSQRLGHLDVHRIAKLSEKQMQRYVGLFKGEISLHRFPAKMSRSLILACKRLVSDYDGDASNIWSGDPGAAAVLTGLQEFHGIGQKIGNMMVRLLIQYYGVKISNWHKVDVAVDRHVARVFLRTGLVSGWRESRIVDIRDEVIETARHLSPKYPAALDEPAFAIGKYWCTAEEAYCWHEDGDCPLAKVCTKRKRSWQVR